MRRSLLPAALLFGVSTILLGCSDSPTSDSPAAGATPDTVVDLWTPAAIGDVATLAARLDRAGDIDARDPIFETTALAFTVDFGQADAVTLLLEAGADPDARNGNGSTPAIGAAFFGRPECLRLLLEAGPIRRWPTRTARPPSRRSTFRGRSPKASPISSRCPLSALRSRLVATRAGDCSRPTEPPHRS